MREDIIEGLIDDSTPEGREKLARQVADQLRRVEEQETRIAEDGSNEEVEEVEAVDDGILKRAREILEE